MRPSPIPTFLGEALPAQEDQSIGLISKVVLGEKLGEEAL
jgi:hypothetical protein